MLVCLIICLFRAIVTFHIFFLLKCICPMSINKTSYQYSVFFISVQTGSELIIHIRNSCVNISGQKQKRQWSRRISTLDISNTRISQSFSVIPRTLRYRHLPLLVLPSFPTMKFKGFRNSHNQRLQNKEPNGYCRYDSFFLQSIY